MNIGIVVVTFNRLNKLKIALDLYENQTLTPAYILVVDNKSTDGTAQFLKKWQSSPGNMLKKVKTLPENTGGSGGFYMGLKSALEMDADWIWVGDDDAYPSPDCILKVNQFIVNHDMSTVSALCGKVQTQNGIDTWHRRILERHFGIVHERRINEAEYNKKFCITFFSYVGSVISKDALLKCGLPEKKFFIAYDDSEHSYRLSKCGNIICLPDVCIYHDTDNGNCKYSWKQYYGIRNKLFSYRKHFGFLQFMYLTFYYLIKNSLNSSQRKMTIAAICDAYVGNLGQHPEYQTGWKG